MSAYMQEFSSYDHFRRIVPRNPRHWEGEVILYSAWNRSFFDVAFGSGDNLSSDDIRDGFDDYIMVEQYGLDGTWGMEDIIGGLKLADHACDEQVGLEEIDGGQLLLKRKDWENGDIRRFLMESLDFAGYKVPASVNGRRFADIIYIGADYDRRRID